VKLARSYRSGDLTPVWVPDADHEALRDLVRAREDAKQDQLRARHRLGKFLLRHGCRPPQEIKKNWTQKHMDWVKRQVKLEQPALQAAFLDYVHEVEHAADRLQGLEKALDDAVAVAPAEMQEVVKALQACAAWAKSWPSAWWPNWAAFPASPIPGS
jgi:transposase